MSASKLDLVLNLIYFIMIITVNYSFMKLLFGINKNSLLILLQISINYSVFYENFWTQKIEMCVTVISM